MKITVEKEIMMTRLDGEAALLNVKTGKYFSLNTSGVRVWDLIEKYGEAETILNVMLDDYQVHKDILWSDINKLLTRLEEAELVKLG